MDVWSDIEGQETNRRVGGRFGSCERGWGGKPWTTKMVRHAERKDKSDLLTRRVLQIERTKTKGKGQR